MFIRKRKEKNYTMIDNHAVLNPKLSYKAKGILLYLMSRPENWKVYLNDLMNRSADGRTSVENGLKELTEQHYLIKFQYRAKDGRFDTLYYYDDVPFDMESDEVKELYELFTVVENKQRSTDVDNTLREMGYGKSTTNNKRTSNKRTNKNIINKEPATIDGRNPLDLFRDIIEGKI